MEADLTAPPLNPPPPVPRFFFQLFSLALVIHYLPAFKGDMPEWLAYTLSVNSLVYQTLDNMDGKQARRTGNSSPLGLLFDHGLDTLNVAICCVCLAAVLQSGVGGALALVWICGILGMYFSAWEQWCTGEFALPIVNGPNEGVLVGAGLIVASSWYGPALWDGPLVGLLPAGVAAGLPLPHALSRLTVFEGQICLSLAVAGSALVANIWNAKWSAHRAEVLGLGFVPAVLRLVPFCACVALYVGWGFLSGVFHRETWLFLLAGTLFYWRATALLMLSHMTGQPFEPHRHAWMLPFFVAPLLGVCRVLGLLPGGLGCCLVPSDGDILKSLCAWASLVCSHAAHGLISEFCDVLGIQCFRVKPVGKPKAA